MDIIDKYLEEFNFTKEERPVIYNMFNVVKSASNGRDIDEMNLEDFVEMFKRMNFKSTQSFLTVKSRFKACVKWAVENNYMTEEQLKYIIKIKYEDIEDLEVIRNSYVSSLDELISIIDEPDPSGTGKYNTLKSSAFLCWYGIKPAEVVDVKKEDVHEDVIEFDGINYPIDDKRVKEFLKEYKELTSCVTDFFGRETEMPYKDSEYLIRTFKNSHLTYKQLRASTSFLNKNVLEKEISLGKVRESGIFYRMYLDEKENGEFKPKQVERVTSFFRAEKNMTAQHISHKLKDYRRWKRAFY